MDIAKFQLGNVYSSENLNIHMQENIDFFNFCSLCLSKHLKGEWGDLEPEDLESNNEALLSNKRLLSCYLIPENLNILNHKKLWIITEWDRNSTTLLFPVEY